ncbi:hypothetical protein [Rhizobium leguminosarum]|uniref:hypothetical protein n=1 Tax=Rhizobium leguminosarum TaxID=384 RepID=UPI0024B342D9|nr:hypothetical protein [Rhizobium leguminosarum]WHO77448.1 hypothetical protein QMO81_000076 [Rhizobium leguminosarum]
MPGESLAVFVSSGSTGAARQRASIAISFGFLSVFMVGCQTAQDRQLAIDAGMNARLERYNGVSMAEFQSRTGMLPIDAYPVSEGRVFVFRTVPVCMTLPATNVTPMITRAALCQLLIRAAHKGGAGTADKWIIKGTAHAGACNNLPV